MKSLKQISMGFLKEQKGFSLMEVLIALFVLMVGLLGVAGMQLMSVSGNAFGREMQLAILVGQDFLEQTKTLTYTDINLSDGAPGVAVVHDAANLNDTIPHSVTPDPNNPGLQFTRSWTVTANSPATNNLPVDSKTIITTMSWNDKSGNHSIQLSTIKCR